MHKCSVAGETVRSHMEGDASKLYL